MQEQHNHMRFLIFTLLIGIGAVAVVLVLLTKSEPVVIEKIKVQEVKVPEKIITPQKEDTKPEPPAVHSSLAKDIIDDENVIEPTTQNDEEISYQLTNGEKHSIPLEKILAGGPPKDGIPSIDEPTFTSIKEAKEINNDGIGIAVSDGDTHKFYPFQILVWHEIVNDSINGQPILVTYCPLCGTGIVFDPIINEQAVEFGTSGKLYQSNLIMYDRLTDSYWSQVLGEAVVGELTGQKLALHPYNVMRFNDWKKEFPNGQVLSTDTGFSRNYSQTPYGDYDDNRALFFPVDNQDDRFHPKSPTLGLELNDEFKVYPIEELEKGPTSFSDTIAGQNITVTYNTETKVATFIETQSQQEIVPTYGFWFSWMSVHPESEVYESN